jgi:hypothetical protein
MRRIAVFSVAVVAALAGASGSVAAAAAGVSRASGSTGTVWLCRPGQADDPCLFSTRSTAVPAKGQRTIQDSQAATTSAFDCFYVYPTVSTQTADNSNLTVQSSEIGAAVAQASRFSQVCRVWAPMYRQRTEASLLQGLGADSGRRQPVGGERRVRGSADHEPEVASAWAGHKAGLDPLNQFGYDLERIGRKLR